MDKQADNLRIRATQLGRLGVSPGAALRMVSLLKEGNNVWRKQRSKVGFRWVKVVPSSMGKSQQERLREQAERL